MKLLSAVARQWRLATILLTAVLNLLLLAMRQPVEEPQRLRLEMALELQELRRFRLAIRLS